MSTTIAVVRVQHRTMHWHQTPSRGYTVATPKQWYRQNTIRRQRTRPGANTENFAEKWKPPEQDVDENVANENG